MLQRTVCLKKQTRWNMNSQVSPQREQQLWDAAVGIAKQEDVGQEYLGWIDADLLESLLDGCKTGDTSFDYVVNEIFNRLISVECE